MRLVLGVLVDRDALNLFYGCGAALIILGFVSLEERGKLPVPRLLVFLGEASYAIYLVHYTAISFGVKGLMELSKRHHMSDLVLFTLTASIALVVGIGFHLLVEKPILNRIPVDVLHRYSDHARSAKADCPPS
jgi:peptidoglycan/LPS O-acetylase OafA/YrhL